MKLEKMWCTGATEELKSLLANEKGMSNEQIDEYLNDAWMIRYNENGEISVKWQPETSDNFFDILNDKPKTEVQRYLEARQRRRNKKNK
tara:strand:+ start:1458 stop:1724 length:267 start_codon:yes stop_codon:yes gene_type:complete